MNDSSAASPRIQILDIIRGIAVLGILGVNIYCYAFPEILANALPVTDPDQGLGYFQGVASEIFLSGKMRSLFAMLFGISSVIILDRLTKRYDGLKASQIFFRRMCWLLIFGQIHGFLFLFYGDILFHYGIVGMIAFPLYFASPRVRKLIMLICLVVLTYKPYSDYVYTGELREEYVEFIQKREGGEELSYYEEMVVEEWETDTAYISPVLDDYVEELEAKQGGFLTTFDFNRAGVVQMATYDLYNWYGWEILLYMLLGVSLFRSGFFRDEFPSSKLLRIAVLGLTIGGLVHAWVHLGFYNTYSDHARSIYYLIFFDLGRLPMVLGYVALFILIFRQKLFAKPAAWLAATGKMTLTNYLMQSIIAAVVFYGFRQFNHLDRVQLGFVVLAIWTFQIVFSNLWMKSFTYGPFEWVWRSLTYCKVQPLRR